MNKEYLLIGIIAVAIILLLWMKFNTKPSTSAAAESTNTKTLIVNDKIAIIDDVSEEDIKKILRGFCDLYNKNKVNVILRLSRVSDRKYAVTFPYDIEFEYLCFFINYANYPMGFDKKFKTIGWATTKPSDQWITDKSANKNVMLYVSDYDTEFDNVFLATSDNIGYKLGFAMGEEKQILDIPEKYYIKPPISVVDLDKNQFQDFK